MLDFLYSGSYEMPQLGSNGLNAAHQAQLYIAAQMYHIPDLEAVVVSRLEAQLVKCQQDLPELSPPWPVLVRTQEEIDRILESFKAFLDAIGTLLDKTSEDDVTKEYLWELDWGHFAPLGQYRAPWIAFVGKHPEYMVDMLASHTNSQYMYQITQSDSASGKRPASKYPAPASLLHPSFEDDGYS